MGLESHDSPTGLDTQDGFFTQIFGTFVGMTGIAGRVSTCLFFMAILGFSQYGCFRYLDFLAGDFSPGAHSSRDLDGSYRTFYNIALEIMQHHFFHILLFKSGFQNQPKFKGKETIQVHSLLWREEKWGKGRAVSWKISYHNV